MNDVLSSALPPLLMAPILSMIVAQVVKPLAAVLLGHPLRWSRMFDTGGMPSSHTSLVTTLTLAVGEVEGISSTLFSIVLVFSAYFVFEATGLRQEVGQQAKVLNDMLDDMYKTHHLDATRLRELVGHTWKEVFGGILVGVVVFLATKSWILSA